MGLLEIVGTIVSGGATGLIGVVAQRVADYKNKQLDMQLEAQRFSHEVEKRKIDMEIMKQEWAGRAQVAVEEARGAEAVADAKALAASFAMEPQSYVGDRKLTSRQVWLMVLLDVLRGSIRPVLTIYLCVLTTYVWFQVQTVLGKQQLDVAGAVAVWNLVVQTILYLTTTCVLWWFGTRNKGKAPA